jgi:hypothetical protein
MVGFESSLNPPPHLPVFLSNVQKWPSGNEPLASSHAAAFGSLLQWYSWHVPSRHMQSQSLLHVDGDVMFAHPNGAHWPVSMFHWHAALKPPVLLHFLAAEMLWQGTWGPSPVSSRPIGAKMRPHAQSPTLASAVPQLQLTPPEPPSQANTPACGPVRSGLQSWYSPKRVFASISNCSYTMSELGGVMYLPVPFWQPMFITLDIELLHISGNITSHSPNAASPRGVPPGWEAEAGRGCVSMRAGGADAAAGRLGGGAWCMAGV